MGPKIDIPRLKMSKNDIFFKKNEKNDKNLQKFQKNTKKLKIDTNI